MSRPMDVRKYDLEGAVPLGDFPIGATERFKMDTSNE